MSGNFAVLFLHFEAKHSAYPTGGGCSLSQAFVTFSPQSCEGLPAWEVDSYSIYISQIARGTVQNNVIKTL